MQERAKSKKKIIIVFVVVGIALAVLLLLAFAADIFTGLFSEKTDTRYVDETIKFAKPDYNIDIYSDPVYRASNHGIFYSEYGTGELIEDKYENFGPVPVFFRNYFDCLIEGNYKDYKNFFTEEFFKFYTIPQKFTKQKIYDIKVDMIDKRVGEDKGSNFNGQEIITFIVDYKIMNNNGTFRGDVPSDTVKSLYFEIIGAGGGYLINKINFISYK